MSTARNQARVLRGCLVGGCSALVATGAHAGAGGELPHGGALVVALLVCAAVGAAAGAASFEGRLVRVLGVIAALGVAQVLCHTALVMAGGHHHHGGFDPTPAMVASHAAAAVSLGVVIAAVEYLFAVGASVLCWLRLFAVRALRPPSTGVRRTPYIGFAQSFWARSGLSMRAPPAVVTSTA